MHGMVKKYKYFIADLIIRIRHFIFFTKMKTIKFNIGSGMFKKDMEWYCTDIDTLDITSSANWRKILFTHRIDNIMAEHVWEHLSDEDSILANKNCYKFLKKNGVLRIAVPDGFHPDKDYIGYVKPGGHGAGAEDHKILYNYISLRDSLVKVGFHVCLLEYWDESGNFHCTNWTDNGGHITRSKRYDPRNQNGSLNYTSLIVDAIKP